MPTNTDAELVTLGRLGTSLAGGSIMLDGGAGARGGAVRGLAGKRFGHRVWMSRRQTPSSRVANANMADAVRLISISRGYDPRDFALVAFGGAGALHGAAIAQRTRRSRR